jgi:hypothetical protein
MQRLRILMEGEAWFWQVGAPRLRGTEDRTRGREDERGMDSVL